MNDTKLREFFFHLSYGEHEGSEELFNKLLFCVYSRDMDSQGFVGETIHQPYRRLLRDIKRADTRYPNVTLHHIPQRLKARAESRKNSDIEAIRNVIADIDRPLQKEELKEIVAITKPYIVVESSPNKFHFYWTLKPGVILPKEYSRVTKEVALCLGGDEGMKAPCHNLRVPLFQRYLKQPKEELNGHKPKRIKFTPAFVVLEQNRYSFDLTAIQSLREKYQKPPEDKKQADSKLGYSIKANKNAFKEMSEEEFIERLNRRAKNKGRNETLRDFSTTILLHRLDYLAEIYETDPDLVDEKIEDKINQLNDHFESPLDGQELSGITASRQVFIKDEIAKYKHKKKLAVDTFSNVQEEAVSKKKIYQIVLQKDLIDDSDLGSLADARFTDQFLATETYENNAKKIFTIKGKFYVFNDAERYWMEQDDSLIDVRKMVSDTISTAVQDETFKLRIAKTDSAGNFIGGIDSKKAQQEYDRLLSHTKNTAITKKLLSSTMIPVKSIFDLNADDQVVAAEDGFIINLIEDKIRHAKPTDYITSCVATKYDSDARCPRFFAWLSEIFSENDYPSESIKSLQHILGYSISGGNKERVVFCHVGDGSNGKSLVLRLLSLLSGSYGESISGEYLVNPSGKTQRFNRHSPERALVTLEGKRIITVDDLKGKNYVWNEEMIKAVTAETLPARYLYKEKRTIPNKAKVHVALNDFPGFESDGFHMRRRFLILKYNKQFKPDAHKESEIIQMFKDEMPGILNWIVEGTRLWYKAGLHENKEMESFTDTIYESKIDIDEKDAFLEVMEEADALDPLIPAELLYNSYRTAMKFRNSYHADINKIEFGRKLKLYFKCEPSKIKGSMCYPIKLKDPMDDDEKAKLI